MTRLLLLALLSFTLFSSDAYTETCLSDFFYEVPDATLQDKGFQIDTEIQKKYQLIAKQFVQRGLSQTSLVTYETLDNGVNLHVGWYVDGYIATALNGVDCGKQIIFINGVVTGISYNVTYYNGYFVHYYAGLKVTSYSNSQFIKS